MNGGPPDEQVPTRPPTSSRFPPQLRMYAAGNMDQLPDTNGRLVQFGIYMWQLQSCCIDEQSANAQLLAHAPTQAHFAVLMGRSAAAETASYSTSQYSSVKILFSHFKVMCWYPAELKLVALLKNSVQNKKLCMVQNAAQEMACMVQS